MKGGMAYLCAPQAKSDCPAGAIADFLGKEAGAWVVLAKAIFSSASDLLQAGHPRPGRKSEKVTRKKKARRESFRTITRPLMPTMKSNHGSMASCVFELRSTWNPNRPCCCFARGSSPSRRDMKRLRALNMVGVCTTEGACRGERVGCVCACVRVCVCVLDTYLI